MHAAVLMLSSCLSDLHRMTAARNSVQLHTLKTADTGLSRMLLWWMWKMGAAAVNDVFYPAGAQAAAGSLAQGLGSLKSLFRSECLLAHQDTPVFFPSRFIWFEHNTA